jgi:hypothetical protein
MQTRDQFVAIHHHIRRVPYADVVERSIVEHVQVATAEAVLHRRLTPCPSLH